MTEPVAIQASASFRPGAIPGWLAFGIGISPLLVAVPLVSLFSPAICTVSDSTVATLDGVGKQVELFRLQCGRYPTDAEGLSALYERPEQAEVSQAWKGPYVQCRHLDDGWHRPIQYRMISDKNRSDFELRSAGPDGKFGTGDDVVHLGGNRGKP